MRAYHESRGEAERRRRVIIPDSAHGTNPASVTLSGYEVATVGTNARGGVDLDALRALLDDDVAGIMLTNPSTLGLFEEDIVEIAEAVHGVGGLLYYDGANLNAILGRRTARRHGLRHRAPERAQDLRHPPRRGRPRRRPGRGQRRTGRLPARPAARRATASGYELAMPERSIGRLHSWHGNALVLLRAWMYLRLNGGDGLQARVGDRGAERQLVQRAPPGHLRHRL